ncbi:MAG: hypothetical protein EOS52_07215 [Mesorhizobium sp.]|uniref:hypothetical protein n=1 Tax=Mesorhizobium sp. TaxID=1871066 RepID=UPI000FE866FF|nr:hypothetical protein [Mesorhizobium sp.]RWC15934.1 MAG: hypothetical protein EOS52_07215 [Mesorhizobium sp.]
MNDSVIEAVRAASVDKCRSVVRAIDRCAYDVPVRSNRQALPLRGSSLRAMLPCMLTKTHLLALEPDMRAFTLVGAFMGYFALLEVGINAAIGEVIGITGARLSIVSRNMGFDDKIKTLRALVDFHIADLSQAAKFDELARRARKYGEFRNIVAHNPFRRSHISDGVEFFQTSASSKLDFPKMDWSIDEFLKRIDEINQIDNDLRSIEHRMSIHRIAELLKSGNVTTDTIEKGTDLGLLSLFGLDAMTFLDDSTPDEEQKPQGARPF